MYAVQCAIIPTSAKLSSKDSSSMQHPLRLDMELRCVWMIMESQHIRCVYNSIMGKTKY